MPVRIQMPGADSLAGFLSVAPRSAIYEGSETLFELLNSPLRVLPFILASDESVLLVTRQHLEWVEAGEDADPELVSPRPYLVTREEVVAVEWLDGTLLKGRLPMELPDDINRASDYMNSDDDFFPLVMESGTMLVNKLRLRAVRIFSASPRPTATII
ncbi:MAG: hypothetical protein ACRENS_04250, partial [Candidatus Eiseniibacteriota bacterium]